MQAYRDTGANMACLVVKHSACLVIVCMLFYMNSVYGQDTLNPTSSKKDTSDRSINEIKEDVTMPHGLEETTTIKNSITTADSRIDEQTTNYHTETIETENTKERTQSERISTAETTAQKTRSSTTKATQKLETTPKPTQPHKRSLDPTDQYLLDGILDIVDEKFSTISKRLMTLERGVNNLQYYNVRSFRVVNTHLHAVDTILHTMHSQVDRIEENGKVFEQIVGAVKDEVVDLQTMNSGMFQAIEQNLIHFHTDLVNKISNVKEGIEHTNANMQQLKNDTAEIRDQIGIVKQSQDDLYQNAAANAVITSELLENSQAYINFTLESAKEQKVGIRMSREINATLSEISRSVSTITIGTFEIKQSVESALSNISIAKVDSDNTDDNDNYREFRPKNTHVQMTCGKLLDIIDEKFKHINVTIGDNNVKCNIKETSNSMDSREFKNQTKKLLRALSTVNENIYQSVTLYKHTGNLIERVISDTEQMATEQVRLREEVLAYLMNGTFDLFNQSIPDVAATIASRKDEPTAGIDGSQCAMSKTLVDEILKLSFNGSQFVELLTELATTSSESIKTSIDKLDHEVTRLKKVPNLALPPSIHSKADAFIRDDPKAGGNSLLRDIHNRTDMIYTIVEAVASNTGWIPYMLHHLRFIDSQINKTLKYVNTIDARSEEMLVRQRANMAIMFKPKEFIRDSTTTTTQVPVEHKETVNDKKDKSKTLPKDEILSTNQSSILDHMMDVVYKTNIKISRLIPALTNLLGEPEPYIALVDGQTDREGRVEVYHKGQWGTIAGSLGHVEAAYVCRKLGYLGGISVGSGYFGAGSGQFWNLNVTCLRTRWCHAVTHVEDQQKFDHTQDVGVLCDHMIRMTQTNEDEEEAAARHTGKLEIYHQNTWLPVCYSGWGRVETSVACKQLGFREGSASSVIDETIIDSHWMVNVTCTGEENRLDACAFSGFQFNGCPDHQYVSLICS